MIVALYGVALAMIVGGLAAVVQGYGIIVLERGWTFVIAGSVCASSGAVLLGIAYAGSRLVRLQGEIARLRDRMPRAEPAFPPPPPGLASPAPPVPPPTLAQPAASEGLLAGGGGTAAALGTAGAALGAVMAGDGITATDLPPPAPLTVPEPRPDERSGTEEMAAASPARTPSDFAGLMAGELEPETAERADHSADQDSEPNLPGPIAPEAPVVDKPAPEDETLFEPDEADADQDDDLFEPEAETSDLGLRGTDEDDRDGEEIPSVPIADRDLAEPSAQGASAEPETDEDETVPDAPLAVVGTYTSGGTRYVMFSDGSIEAETPNGTFQFGSLDELKAFIASGEGEAH